MLLIKLALSTVAIMTLSLATSQEVQAQEPAKVNRGTANQPTQSKVRQLQKERLAVLRQIAAYKKELVQQLKATPDVMFQADLAALKAELELCDSDDARIVVLQKIVVNASKQEENSEGLYKGGRIVHPEFLAAKANRLEAEVELERAKAKVAAKVK